MESTFWHRVWIFHRSMFSARAAAVGVIALAACGRAPEEAALAPARSELQAAFEAAAREYQVPVQLLETLAYVETRVSTTPGLVSQTGGHGIMAIVERDDWKMLSRATALTGANAGQLDVDAKANIRGAAAVLRELADKSFRDFPELDARDLGDWYHAVSLYPGFDAASDAHDFAADLFVRMETGFTVPELNLEPTASSWRDHAPLTAAKRDALNGTDYPAAVSFMASPNFSAGRSTYEFVVIHTIQGSYAGCISWFQNPSSDVSAQYVVRSSDGEITQMVRDSNTAWHAQCYNGRSIGIEHEGFVADPGRWYTPAMYAESAKLTRWLTDRYNIPRTRTRIIGHREVAPNCNTGGHTDPGTGWNWTHYMNLVNGTTPTTTTGVLTGAIYTGGDTNNRVAGAVVTVGNQTVTTGANGLYQFTLAPGAHTATVTKAGFANQTTTKTVVAGSTVWGSMNLTAMAAATGVLRGKVYAHNAADPADLTASLSGAVVTVSPGGATATTAADGQWLFNLPPGTYTVTATKAGYANNQQTRMVASGVTTWGSVGLSTTAAPDTQAPVVAITFPMTAAQLDLAVFDVQGTASDDRGPLTTVKLSLNGAAAVDVPVAGGVFTAPVKLKPGTNTLKVTATDAAGNAASAESTATFNAGVAGFVYAEDNEAMRIAGATVELFEPASGASVSTATADAMGNFVLGVMTVPADYKVVVKATGYQSHAETITVGDDGRMTLNVSLLPGSAGPGERSVVFTDPLEGATVTTESVTVYGAASGFEVLSAKVNGVAAELLPGGLAFSATVPLKEGANVLTAEVTGVDGEVLTAKLNVTRKLTAGGKTDDMKAKGGCSAVPGLELLALVLLTLRLRRRG
ncbi:MAG: N-acetylmuramoyl-L-alanine amidase [Myxococcaceae bacterium]|nr:N-acetylmuramoyl-L-alanine amidase [Myxococcaceae bacterium]